MCKIATGRNALAIYLHQFVHDYQPGHWVVPINDVAHVPYFLEDDIIRFETNINTTGKPLGVIKLNDINDKYPWYVQEAIEKFFKEQRTLDILSGKILY